MPIPERDLRQIAEALETAFGCLDLVSIGRKPSDLVSCIDEIRAARELAWNALEATNAP